jgi:hypothetical protein
LREIRMMSQFPQWPDEPAQPDRPDQPPGNGSPLSRLARSRRELTVLAIVTGVLIVALLGMLALALSSNAHGAQAQTEQSGQAQNGQGASADGAQTVTAGGGGNGASSGGSTPTPGGGSSGGGGIHPTPTPAHGAATPTPTSGVVTGCCLTFGPSVHQVVSQATLSGTSVGPVVATCPAGEIALSGGWAVAYNSGATIYRSARTGTGGWGVYVRHPATVGVTTYAECLSNASGASIAERVEYTSVGAHGFGRTLPSCNAGEVLVGGGFALATGLELDSSEPNPALPMKWDGFSYNHGDSPASMNGYAECLAYARAHSSQTSSGGATIADGARGGTTSPACPSGTYVSGGGYGYATEATAFVYAMWASGSGTTWTADLYAYGGADATLNSYAMCLGFS